MQKTIYIAGDHAAFELKEKIIAYLKKQGYTVKDFGPHKYDPNDDYPDFIIPMAKAVAAAPRSRTSAAGATRSPTSSAAATSMRGIALGGSGIGECIAANKVNGIRAVLAWNKISAKMSRWHNDTNVLCLGGGQTVDKTQNVGLTFAQAKPIINTWLATPFSGEARHIRRLKKIESMLK